MILIWLKYYQENDIKKILITGGAGLIGSNLVKHFVHKKNYDIYVADNLWRGKIENLYDNGSPLINLDTNFFNIDLRSNTDSIAATKNMDIVIHLADIVAGINYVFKNEFFLYQANTLINTNVLAASIENKVKKYIYVGTACSYPAEMQSELNPPPFKEEDVYPANPESSYGWSKLMGEYEAELASKEGSIETGILRLHNVYGPPCELSNEKSQVIPALIRKAINYPKEDFIVWGSGQQRRAFLYVNDVVNGIQLLLKKGLNQGPIQIGPTKSNSIGDIAKKIVSLSGKDIKIIFDPSMPEGDKDRMADIGKAKRILNWSQNISLDEGLEKTFFWSKNFLNNQ